MIGFKAFDKNLKCRCFQYEIGHTYEFDGKPIVCKQGFHFCKSIAETYNYYPMSEDVRICRVEAIGEISTDDELKYCTNKIKICEEVTEDWKRKGNTNSSSSGYCNTGNCNTGDWNTGDWNTGNCNTGDWNTGDRNTGNRNTGDWNTTRYSSGCFNTKEKGILMFDKPTEWTIDEWRDSAAYRILRCIPREIVEWISCEDMTDEEKEKYPACKTTGGYLKVLDEREAVQDYWNGLSEYDKQKIYDLPNFDREIFKQCTGIEVEE